METTNIKINRMIFVVLAGKSPVGDPERSCERKGKKTGRDIS